MSFFRLKMESTYMKVEQHLLCLNILTEQLKSFRSMDRESGKSPITSLFRHRHFHDRFPIVIHHFLLPVQGETQSKTKIGFPLILFPIRHH